MPEEEIKRRLASAKKEIEQAGECDYQVENEWGKVNECVGQVERIIMTEIKTLFG